ncbi:HlyD family secretion protein [Devosia lacusdianchii]|uniref:HlyD family secretion protein n=1 Tax=Devosia lacusdianchii TaxID=2917991 RepID=UPI001F069A31|nr:HlyD family secretion protein [Devosia sp. JXJ CY 41]
MAQVKAMIAAKDGTTAQSNASALESNMTVLDSAATALESNVAVLERVEAAPQAPAPEPALLEPTAATEPVADAAKPNPSRRRAGRIALLMLVGLGAAIAWYPLSDHHAPYSGGASIIADVTQISARVPGQVAKVSISDNAAVKAGDTLFQIDPTTYEMDVEQAQAQLAQVLNSAGSSFAAIPAAEAKLQQAQIALNTANDDLDRAQQLFDKGLVPPAKLSLAESNQQSSALNVRAASAEVDRLRMAAGAEGEDNPNVRAARAAVAKAEFALASTTIVAPTDGYVSNLSLTEGQFVGAGTAAMTFINPASQMVIADFRENQLINVEPGDKAIVTFEAAPGRQFPATVESIAWGISSGRVSANGLSQPTTDTRWFPPARKIPVRVVLDDFESLPANVRLGSEAGVLVIPEDGIIPAIAQTMLGIGGILAGFN